MPVEVEEWIKRQLCRDASNTVEVDEGSVGRDDGTWDRSPAASVKGGIHRMNGQETKGFFEKQFSTVYALWKAVGKFRSGSGNSSQVQDGHVTRPHEPVSPITVAQRVLVPSTQVVGERRPQEEPERPSAPPAAVQQPSPPQQVRPQTGPPRQQPKPPQQGTGPRGRMARTLQSHQQAASETRTQETGPTRPQTPPPGHQVPARAQERPAPTSSGRATSKKLSPRPAMS